MSDTIAIGTRLTASELESLPPGSIVGDSFDVQFRRQEDGSWRQIYADGSDGERAVTMEAGSLILLGHSATERAREPYNLYVWRFREHALNGATNHGISIAAVWAALKQLKLDALTPVAGWPLALAPREDLPVGTLAAHGDPSNFRSLCVWSWTGDRWEPLLGDYSYREGARIEEGSGEVAYQEGDEEKILAFKAEAWRTGLIAKRRHDWCGSFESVMNQFGINASALAAIRHGDIAVGSAVTPEQAATLPLGSVLETDGEFFYRTDDVSNIAGTRRLVTDSTRQRNYRPSMTVRHIGQPPTPIEVTLNSEQRLPAGSLLRISGSPYTVCSDGASYEYGMEQRRYTNNSLAGARWTVERIGPE